MSKHAHLGSSSQQQTGAQVKNEKSNPSDRMIIAMLEGLTNKVDYLIKQVNSKTDTQKWTTP